MHKPEKNEFTSIKTTNPTYGTRQIHGPQFPKEHYGPDNTEVPHWWPNAESINGKGGMPKKVWENLMKQLEAPQGGIVINLVLSGLLEQM